MPLSVFSIIQVFASIALSAGAKSVFMPASSISQHQWDRLNATVGGRLSLGIPYSEPCFSNFNGHNVTPNTELCNVLQENYTNPFYRVEQFGGWMEPQWESCIETASVCVLDDSNPFDPVPYSPPMTCNQGSVPSFYIDVQEASDIQAAFNFTASTGVPLTIKNTGHDYKGRSSGPGSLNLWVHRLQQMSYNKTFIPEGCVDHSSYPAMSVGAGVVWDSAYAFADAQGATIVGGYHETVGVSGGWIMGGGHSVLSPAYGLGVDRVLQFTIVTPDGQIRISNACQNSDLFWALRGGGGGTFGVVLESVHEVIPYPVPLQGLILNYTMTSENIDDFYAMVIENTVVWHEQQWGGHVELNEMIYVTPNLTLEEAIEAMQPAIAFAEANGGYANVTTFDSWYSFYLDQVKSKEAFVGITLALAERLIPNSLFLTEDGRSKILGIIKQMLSLGGTPYIPATTPPTRNGSTNSNTSVTPAWYNSLWSLEVPLTWQWNSSVDAITQVFDTLHELTDMMNDLAPDSGSYLNEGDVFQTDFEEAFWGPNYPRLQEIKQKYDPEHLLDCHQCVSFEPESPRYQCYPVVSSA